jgi:hypothetical protein
MPRFLARLSMHERASEAMVGLLVALAARGGIHISTEHPAEPATLALVSFGATLTWAVLDAFFALMAAKGSRRRWAHLTDDRRDPAERGHEWADEALNHTFLENLEEPAMKRIRDHAIKEAANARPVSPRLTSEDWLTAAAVFVVVPAGRPAAHRAHPPRARPPGRGLGVLRRGPCALGARCSVWRGPGGPAALPGCHFTRRLTERPSRTGRIVVR